ncbi:FkbM family methyltransferase [Aquabacter spiritensis]|uniref:FkbM family methyltransferase n=1 Tax=Aquabacter spiritensis TaxID=933073 RepID=A0A4R3LZ05_9HYPH|nr:FkbM family methyltransferase [Aquabacter spiritensis]TCT04005.1 FkbM family methyltransferase [Aquabacter spiritensis]
MTVLRYPVLTQCLRLVREISPAATRQIVDVGVQVKTDFLMEVFPDRHHHLFEPTTLYHPQLEKNYRDKGIDFTLHKIALSDSDGVLYLHNTSNDGSGRVTHAQIRPERDEGMQHLVKIEEVATRRLDTAFAENPLEDLSYIVKLDVDGVEERIIAGGAAVLKGASFIIIETSIGRQDMCSRAALLEKLGFRIFDICDNAYYYGQLALVDLVMINNRLRNTEIKYRPWSYADGKVHWPKWQHGFRDLEKVPFGNPYD